MTLTHDINDDHSDDEFSQYQDDDPYLEHFLREEARFYKRKDFDINQSLNMLEYLFETKIRNRSSIKRFKAQEKQYLEEQYLADPNWSKAKIKEIAEHLNLTELKVYKWKWHRQKLPSH